MPGIRSHDLRRAAASLAFAQGASVKEVQTMLRHTRQATTADVYVHVMESVRQGTASKMDKDPYIYAWIRRDGLEECERML